MEAACIISGLIHMKINLICSDILHCGFDCYTLQTVSMKFVPEIRFGESNDPAPIATPPSFT